VLEGHGGRVLSRVFDCIRGVLAPTIDELVLADEPERWSALGFKVADGRCELGAVRLTFTKPGPGSRHGLLSWSLRDLEETDLDGLTTSRSERPLRPSAPAQPNGVLAIDHIVVSSPAFERSVSALQGAGLDLRRVREEPTPAGAPRQAFFRLGEEILELVAEPEEVIERAGGPDRPARFWGLALLSGDLERTVEAIGAHAGPIRPAVQPGRSIATVRRAAGLSIPLALMSVTEPSGGS
jgi:hypothetical protein